MRYVFFPSVALLLAGCAQFSVDGGMSDVASGVQQQIGKEVVKISTDAQAGRAREQVTALLAGTLSAEQAVQVALHRVDRDGARHFSHDNLCRNAVELGQRGLQFGIVGERRRFHPQKGCHCEAQIEQ